MQYKMSFFYFNINMSISNNCFHPTTRLLLLFSGFEKNSEFSSLDFFRVQKHEYRNALRVSFWVSDHELRSPVVTHPATWLRNPLMFYLTVMLVPQGLLITSLTHPVSLVMRV